MKVRGTDQKEHNLKPEQNLMKVRGTDQWQDNLYNIKSIRVRGADQWHNNY